MDLTTKQKPKEQNNVLGTFEIKGMTELIEAAKEVEIAIKKFNNITISLAPDVSKILPPEQQNQQHPKQSN